MSRERFNKRIEMLNQIAPSFKAIEGPLVTIRVSHADGWTSDFHPSLDISDKDFVKEVLVEWNCEKVPDCTCDTDCCDEHMQEDHTTSCPFFGKEVESFLKVPEHFLFEQCGVENESETTSRNTD